MKDNKTFETMIKQETSLSLFAAWAICNNDASTALKLEKNIGEYWQTILNHDNLETNFSKSQKILCITEKSPKILEKNRC